MYPILSDGVVGESARQPFNDAQELLKDLIENKLLTASAIVGFWPAFSNGEDILVYEDESREKVAATFHHLRQQMNKPNNQPNFCLSDYIAPASTGLNDFLGGFVVSTGFGLKN